MDDAKSLWLTIQRVQKLEKTRTREPQKLCFSTSGSTCPLSHDASGERKATDGFLKSIEFGKVLGDDDDPDAFGLDSISSLDGFIIFMDIVFMDIVFMDIVLRLVINFNESYNHQQTQRRGPGTEDASGNVISKLSISEAGQCNSKELVVSRKHGSVYSVLQDV